jgi:hypothetical protein
VEEEIVVAVPKLADRENLRSVINPEEENPVALLIKILPVQILVQRENHCLHAHHHHPRLPQPHHQFLQFPW